MDTTFITLIFAFKLLLFADLLCFRWDMSWPAGCSPAVASSSNTTTKSQSTCCLIFCSTCCWAARPQSNRRWGHTCTDTRSSCTFEFCIHDSNEPASRSQRRCWPCWQRATDGERDVVRRRPPASRSSACRPCSACSPTWHSGAATSSTPRPEAAVSFASCLKKIEPAWLNYIWSKKPLWL